MPSIKFFRYNVRHAVVLVIHFSFFSLLTSLPNNHQHLMISTISFLKNVTDVPSSRVRLDNDFLSL